MSIFDKWYGQQVVVRTNSAGVHIGTLVEAEGTNVVLTNARRLWKWSGAFTLSEVSQIGILPKNSRMAVAVPAILLTQAIELLPVSTKAQETFDATHE